VAASLLIDRLLDEAPAGAESFRVVEENDSRHLHLRCQLLRWCVEKNEDV
jgi:hypothetical protein